MHPFGLIATVHEFITGKCLYFHVYNLCSLNMSLREREGTDSRERVLPPTIHFVKRQKYLKKFEGK